MVHDPALDAHEHTEHAAHAAHGGHEPDPFMSRVTITVAALAVLAAMAGSLETVEGGRALGASSEAVLAQDKATDSWNEFQADGLKRRMYDAEERAAWHILLDAAQRCDHGQYTRRRLRNAAIQYANAIMNRSDDEANARRVRLIK